MEATPDPGLERVPLSGAIGPRAVGLRVVVRSRVPGENGPTGGPAFTDVLGILEKWADGALVIRTGDDEVVEIATSLVVSGKPVPARPSRFSRLSVDEVERRCADFSRFIEVEEIGNWQARLTGGANMLANSALAVGDPGICFDDALATVEDFYRRHGRQSVVRVVADSEIQCLFEEHGWRTLDPKRTDNEVHLAGVASLARRLAGFDASPVIYQTELTHDWLVGNERAQANLTAVAASLDLDKIVFGSISEHEQQVARARINIVDGWAFLADLIVVANQRRHGLARTMMAGMTQWAAEHGATVMALQVRAENAPAQALYASLGFERHHTYRHLIS